MPRIRLHRRVLDEWFPTYARPIGVVIGLYGVFIDRGKNPFLFPFAGLLIGLPSFIDRDRRDDDSGKGDRDASHADPPE